MKAGIIILLASLSMVFGSPQLAMRSATTSSSHGSSNLYSIVELLLRIMLEEPEVEVTDSTWDSVQGGEEQGDEEASNPFESIDQKLADSLGQAGECLAPGSDLREGVCVGATPLAEKTPAALEACAATAEAGECTLLCTAKALGWIDEHNLRDRDVVRADIEASNVGQSLVGAEDECDLLAHEATCDVTTAGVTDSNADLRNYAYFACLEQKFQAACLARVTDIGVYFAGSQPDIWVQPWLDQEIVPALLSEVPLPLQLQFPGSEVVVTPGTSTIADRLSETPKYYWDADPEALYTLIDVDVDTVLEGIDFFHIRVHNIPGHSVEDGVTVAPWLNPWGQVVGADGLVLPDPENPVSNRHLVVVYKQSGMIANLTPADPEADPCTTTYSFNQRTGTLAGLQESLGLEGPIAGNTYRLDYEESSFEVLCNVKNCNAAAFAFDVPDCEAPADAPAA